jgi:integrase/recombinase XerD
MNFSDSVQQYVLRKHAEGIEFHKGESYLTGLCRHVGDVQLSQVQSQHVLTFLNDSLAAVTTWRLKYFVIQHFFDFWAARGAMPEMLMPPIRPKERQIFLPHVYSRAELRVLLMATVKNQQSNINIARPTMRTFVILLYGTGARVGEMLSLSVGDINLERRSISILNKNPNRCREIPIGIDISTVLQRYLTWRSKGRFLSPLLFVTKLGKPVSVGMANKNFCRLRQLANVTRDSKSTYQPRLHDLQCTFAVHRITSWIRGGTDLNRMLPALAVYMGFVGLSSTERYLHMTPERFKKHLDKLSPLGRKRHWRNDEKLMEFLAGL